MRIARKSPSGVTIGQADVPEPAPGQIRVRVTACGICGTDLQENPSAPDTPEGFGHEIAGVVDALGEGVPNLALGDRIALDSATPCGRCDACRNARQELCTDVQSFFYLGSFGFADYILVPAICAIPCADLDPGVACLQEPLGVAIDMVRLAEIGPQSDVLIMGGGPIGLMALALARAAGARHVFLSQGARRRARCALALKWGADAVVPPEQVTSFAFGCELDRVLVTAPPKTLADAFAVACKGAIVSFVGIEHGDGAFCRFDANAFHFKKLQLRASFASPALFGPLALQYLREGVVDGDALISHRFGLDELAQAMAATHEPDAIKIVVEP
jgi:L-iditol 2-dehydrogenase